jgi:hypothetical protein
MTIVISFSIILHRVQFSVSFRRGSGGKDTAKSNSGVKAKEISRMNIRASNHLKGLSHEI